MGQGGRFLLIFVCALILWGALTIQPPMWVYPSAFGVIFLFYTNTLFERVPLYLSNRTTWAALAECLDSHPIGIKKRPTFVDLGCGLGGMVAYLARTHPQWVVVGVETAPGPYLIAKVRTALQTNAHIRFQSLWSVDLRAFDMAYAFLSPAPMARLCAKVKAQMPANALFISNSFWAEGVPFDGEIFVNDGRKTRLIFSRQEKPECQRIK